MQSTTKSSQTIPPAAAIALVAIIVAVLMVHRIGASDVCNANEAVEGVFVQQMVEQGKLLFPLENGTVPMYKPPLFHWTAVAIDYVAGIRKVSATNLRFPSAMYAIAAAILTMLFAYRILGIESAILAGLALAGSYQYVALGRFGRVDMTLCFFETVALFAFVRWLPRNATTSAAQARRDSSLGALYLMALAMALGVLAKGPVGALIPGISILIFMLVERRWRQILAMLDPGAVIVGVVLASSWYVACYVSGRYEFLDRQLGGENVGRFFGSLGAMSPVYYLKPILLNSAPFSIVLPLAAATALSTRLRAMFFGAIESTVGTDADSNRSSPRALDAVRLFAIFYFVTMVFFSLAAYKRRAYLLPVWPVSAVILAWWIRSLPQPSWRRIASLSFAGVCVALAIFNFIYIPASEVASCRSDSYRPASEEIARVVGADEPLYLYGFAEELAPLLFYLDRDAPVLTGRLGDAPPGYIIVPAGVWKKHAQEALDLEPVLTSDHGSKHLIVLKHGKSYASR
jgi:4-amino-4-deoxy-L-arabinose transferase-like glycosyltransferase